MSGCASVLVGRGALLAGTRVFSGDAPTAEPSLSDEEDGADSATVVLCRRYVRLAIDVENSAPNTAFVLQWMIHARLKERDAAVPSWPTDATTATTATAVGATDANASLLQLCSMLRKLRAATGLAAVAHALDEGSYYHCRPRHEPPPDARRYLGNYFDLLHQHGDWAGVLPRKQIALARAAQRHREQSQHRPERCKRTRHSAADGTIRPGATEPEPSAPLGRKKRRSHGVRLSKSEREARREARSSV